MTKIHNNTQTTTVRRVWMLRWWGKQTPSPMNLSGENVLHVHDLLRISVHHCVTPAEEKDQENVLPGYSLMPRITIRKDTEHRESNTRGDCKKRIACKIIDINGPLLHHTQTPSHRQGWRWNHCKWHPWFFSKCLFFPVTRTCLSQQTWVALKSPPCSRMSLTNEWSLTLYKWYTYGHGGVYSEKNSVSVMSVVHFSSTKDNNNRKNTV